LTEKFAKKETNSRKTTELRENEFIVSDIAAFLVFIPGINDRFSSRTNSIVQSSKTSVHETERRLFF